jgi:hypothetical protein
MAAAATVAPLLQLKRAVRKAQQLSRYSRMAELFARALAAAELAQPRKSLVVAALLYDSAFVHTLASQANPSICADAKRVELKLRLLHLLHERWQAGTLFAPTAEEVAYLLEDEYPGLPAQMCGAYFYITAAHDCFFCLHEQQPANAEARVHAVHGALRAALETDVRGMLERHPRTGQAWTVSSSKQRGMASFLKSAVHRLVTFALSDDAGLLLRMRATCGLTAAEETSLRQLAGRHKAESERRVQMARQEEDVFHANRQRVAAADAALHGLRRCALPACDAQEAHPKLFKLCGRCRGAAYCGAAHCAADWKRHKREDGCKAAP